MDEIGTIYKQVKDCTSLKDLEEVKRICLRGGMDHITKDCEKLKCPYFKYNFGMGCKWAYIAKAIGLSFSTARYDLPSDWDKEKVDEILRYLLLCKLGLRKGEVWMK